MSAFSTPRDFFAMSTVENDQNVEKTGTASKQVVPENDTITQVNDISLCPERMPKELIDYWIVKGAEDLDHSDVKSLDIKSAIQQVSRKCTPDMFERRNRNGEVLIYSWLCFSAANGRVCCFFCQQDPNSHMMYSSNGNMLVIVLVSMRHEQSNNHTQTVL